jgi:hypothetical protein
MCDDLDATIKAQDDAISGTSARVKPLGRVVAWTGAAIVAIECE